MSKIGPAPVVGQRRDKPSKATMTRMRRIVIPRDNWTCQECGKFFEPESPYSGEQAPTIYLGDFQWEYLELDHITPVAAGGLFVPKNLRAACSTCNRKKSASTALADWPARIARALALLNGLPATAATARAAVTALTGGDDS